MKLPKLIITGTIFLAIVVVFMLPFRLSFTRQLLGNVQVLTKDAEFYVFAQTYDSIWRPTPVEYLRSAIGGLALVPPPRGKNYQLHIVKGRGDRVLYRQAYEIETAVGSAFARGNSIYFSHGVHDPKLYPQVFEVSDTQLRRLPREEAWQLVGAGKYMADETRAAGWSSEYLYEMRGERQLIVYGTPDVLRVSRQRNRYDLEVKSTIDGKVVFELHGKS